MWKRLGALLFALGLSSCGFHLRGTVELPCWLTQVSIICHNNTSELMAALQFQFSRYKMEVISDPELASYWLIIENTSFQKQIVSIGSSTNPRQYQLILTIEFSLQTKEGECILSNARVIATRQLTVNNDRILGSTDEERILSHEMKNDAVIQIMNRLASLDHHAN